MAKGFPYFKFIAHEWLAGDIVLEDFELQGIFINVCALYWHRDGKLSISEIQKRLKTERLAELTDRFFSINDGFISIKFLDEQLVAANHISQKNSDNGKKGGRPKSDSKANANRTLTERKAEKSKEEEKEIKGNSKYTLEYFEQQGYQFNLPKIGHDAINRFLEWREKHPSHGAIKSPQQVEAIIIGFRNKNYTAEQVVASVNKTIANGAKNLIMDEVVSKPKAKTTIPKPHPDLPDDWWTSTTLTKEQILLIPSSINAARITAQNRAKGHNLGI